MPHQDTEDLRTPVAELKELLAPIRDVVLASVSRHGNATLDLGGLMVLALLTFGWNQQQTLGDRFKEAHGAAKRAIVGRLLAGSFQSLMVEVAWVSGATRVLKMKGSQGAADATEDYSLVVA